MEDFKRGPVYTVPFSAQALSANAQDLWHIHASTASRVLIREIRFGQYSDAGDAEAELLSVELLAGSTSASAGSAITAVNVQRHSGAPTAGTSCLGPSTTVASTGSAELIFADTVNVAAGWLYAPPPPERITLEPDERLAVRLSAPADALTINGVLTFEEIGRT
jgi:hypothetical protein